MRTTAKVGTLGIVAFLAACQGSPTTTTDPGLSPSLDRDVATVAADAVGEDVEMMGGPGGALGFGIGAAPASDSTDGRRLFCDTHTRGGLALTRTCAFYDADGVEQSAYDPELTASVVLHVTVQGTVDHDRWSAEVDRTRDLTATGLLGLETSRTWNGTGHGSVLRSTHADSTETRTYDLSYETTVIDVIVPVPKTDGSWPLSGTVARVVDVTITGGPRDGQTVHRTVLVTFNGTRYVPIVVNDQTFTLDLLTRQIVDR